MTLNKIINVLKNYFESHLMIRGVSVTLDDANFNAISDTQYPVANIQFVDSDVTATQFRYNFKIIIADLTNPNIEDIDFEIYSDCLQIASDFFGYLNTIYDFDWTKTASVVPFSDGNVDRISGVVFTISLITFPVSDPNCVAPRV